MICAGEFYEVRVPDAPNLSGTIDAEVIRKEGDKWRVRTLYVHREMLVEEWRLQTKLPAWIIQNKLEIYADLVENAPERAARWE